jgi:hypothetical protein
MINKQKTAAFGRGLSLCLGIWISTASAALAIETGEIKGKVVDENKSGLPGVEVTVSGPALQGTRTLVSSKEGDFHIPLLPVGKYTLTFELEGFNTVKQENVVVLLGTTTTLTVTMPLAALRKEIVVTAEIPLIDKTSTDTSYHMSASDLEKIPTQNRTIVDVVKYTPGVTGIRMSTRYGTATEGLPSFRGEGEEGNNWIVDGLSISGVRLRDSGMKLNFDSVEEIQVISDPFSPEFGPAYGGIINMVTKSGSNELRGEASFVFMDKALQATPQPQLSIVSEPADFSDGNGYLDLGGPILKDKLWFFLSENYYTRTDETKDGYVNYLFVPGGRKTTSNNNIFGKLTYSLNSRHNISFTAVYDTSFPQKGGTDFPEMNEEKKYTDRLLRLNYKGILSDSTFIEAGLGQVQRMSLTHPTDGDLGPAMYYVEDLARNIHNSYGNVTDDESRLDASFKLTKFFETETFGHHEINLGFEYYRVASDFRVDFTGKDEDVFPGDGFDEGTKYFFDTWRNDQGTPTFFREYGPFNLKNSSTGIGLYFKDKVTWDRFALMAGIRSLTQACLDDKGKTLWSWGLLDFLSPRFSLAVDLAKDGKNVLKLAWGRFSDMITTMPLGFFNPGAGLSFRSYRWHGPALPSASEIHDPANWVFDNEQKTQPFEVAEGLKPDFETRWLIEFDRRLGPDWAIKARFVHSNAEKLLEVLAIFDPQTLYKFVYDNFEYKRRNYSGFEVELDGKIGTRLFLNASYSCASAEGTNPGQSEPGSWSQEEGSTNYIGLFGKHLYVPPLPELAPLKTWADEQLGGLGGRGIGDEGWYGKLPYSIDHDVKLNAVVNGPLDILFSAAFEYISGYYWEKLGYVPYFGGYYSFPEGRGSRETPPLTYLDVSLEKTFYLSGSGILKKAGLSFRLDVFNLLDSQRPISYVKEDVPIFGEVWARQQPRQARISAKLKF